MERFFCPLSPTEEEMGEQVSGVRCQVSEGRCQRAGVRRQGSRERSTMGKATGK